MALHDYDEEIKITSFAEKKEDIHNAQFIAFHARW